MFLPEQEFSFQLNNKKQGGKPKSIIWGIHIIQGRQISKGHYNTTCAYCKKYWYKGSPKICEEHLANICPEVPPNVRDFFLNRLAAQFIEEESPTYKKRKLNNNQEYEKIQQKKTQLKVSDFIESTRLTEERVKEI